MASNPTETSATLNSHVPPRKGRRYQTEKRKAQNRIAQRKYREKMKTRLETLESLAETSKDPAYPKIPSNDGLNGAQRFMMIETPENMDKGIESSISIDDLLLNASGNQDNTPLEFPFSTYDEHFTGLLDGNQSWFDNELAGSPLWLSQELYQPSNIFTEPAMNQGSSQLSKQIPVNLIQEPSDARFRSLDSIENIHRVSPLILGTSPALPSHLELETTNTQTPLVSRLASPLSTSLISEGSGRQIGKQTGFERSKSATDNKGLASALIHDLRLEDSKENQCLLRTALARRLSIRDVLLAGLQALRSTGLPLPSPQKNTLTLVRTSTLQAYLVIAETIGIDPSDLYQADMISPFYCAGAIDKERQDSLLSSYSSDFMPNLQPTRSQIIHSHHPWVDLIPFPTIRERILSLSSMEPPVMNLKEFKTEMFHNNGLFNWRPAGEDARGQPWNMRSWEAEPCFLKKWWFAVGGSQGEIWDQTNWWRGTRGEQKVKPESEDG